LAADSAKFMRCAMSVHFTRKASNRVMVKGEDTIIYAIILARVQLELGVLFVLWLTVNDGCEKVREVVGVV